MRRGLFAVTMVGVLAAATACGSSGAKGHGGSGGSAAEPQGPKVSITPQDGEKKAVPDKGLVVTAADGTLQNVSVKATGPDGKSIDVPGQLSTDKTSWKSQWTLTPGASYETSATAVGAKGKTSTATSNFKVLMPNYGLKITNVTPNRGDTVGVGMPITVDFNKPVSSHDDRVNVEKSFEIKSDKPVEGAWNWVTNSEVIFRTKNDNYWPANQNVDFTAHLGGVKVGQSYGVSDVTHDFKIGDKHVLYVSAKSDKAVAKENDNVVKSWPVSLGSSDHPTWITTSGIHLTMDHQNPAHMDSKWMGVDPNDKAHGGYSEDVPWATRITNSGEYVHQNMDDPTCLGNRNCSHGCVRSTQAGAQWFYKWSYLGDIVIITGTSNTLAWDNGWGYYQKSWSSWLKGSATGQSVMTDGSTPGSPAGGSASPSGSPTDSPSGTPSSSSPSGF